MIPNTNFYSIDIKYRVIDMHINKNISVNEIVKLLNISKSSIYNWIKNYKTTKCFKNKIKYIKTRSMFRNANLCNFIKKYVEDNQHFEHLNLINCIKISLNIDVRKSSLYNIIHKLNFTHKIVSFKKVYGNSESNIEKLNLLKNNVKNLNINNIISIDEVSFDTNITDNRAWSEKGCVVTKKIGATWNRVTNICAISNKKILHNVTVNNSANSIIFLDFIKQLPLTVDSVLFFDNARIHHSKIVIDYLNEHKIKYVFNVPYCPKYNPIEYMFSKVKKHIKKLPNSKLDNLKLNIQTSYQTVKEIDLTNIFNHAFNLLK